MQNNAPTEHDAQLAPGAASRRPPLPVPAPVDVQAFLMLEADLLDTRELDAWLGLYTKEAVYWVPAEAGETNPEERISLFYDDRSILEDRIWRLSHPKMFSQNPPVRQVRVMSVPVLDGAGYAQEDHMVTRTKFVLFEHRLREQRTFGGEYVHTLVKRDNAWFIKRKVVHLVNCDAVLWNIGVPL
jgi:3-phenylpropionate/cinnamic acid dioxygenase small subunit